MTSKNKKTTEVLRDASKRAFLEAFASIGTITYAAKAVGISRQTHHNWLATDPHYVTDFAEAQEQAAEALEAEARRRAIEGVSKGIYHLGKLVGTELQYSDTLLIFLLKGALPRKYRENIRQELTGPDGEPIAIRQVEIVKDYGQAMAERAMLPPPA